MIEQKLVEINVNELLNKVSEVVKQNYRLVCISCTAGPEYEITYSFDNDLSLLNFRIKVTEETEIPSITAQYGCAFIYENEIKDLFGLKITQISIDYNGNLYKTAVPTPFRAN